MPSDDFLNLQNDVSRHDGELNKQTHDILSLWDGLRVLLECNPGLVDQVKHRAERRVPAIPEEFVQRCRKLLNKLNVLYIP